MVDAAAPESGAETRQRRSVYDEVMAVNVMTTSAPPAAVRIGAVSYLNTRPLVEGLEKCADARLSFDVPSRLLGALLEEDIDVALAPIMDAIRSPEAVAALPVGCIASDGPTRSVKIFSRIPFEVVATLRADPDSKTSVALATMVLQSRFKADVQLVRESRPMIEAITAGVDEDAVLLIGDKVERFDHNQHGFRHVVDLGEAWRDWTTLPFVYAVWVCKASRANDPVIRRAAIALDRQRRHNRTRIAWIAQRRADEHGWSPDEAHAYLNATIETQLGERERSAIDRFQSEAAACGLIAPTQRVVWTD